MIKVRVSRLPRSAWPFVSICQFASAAPTGANWGFENSLTGWTNSGVAIESTQAKVYAGSKSLALRGGFIQQSIAGLQAGSVHTVSLAYRDDNEEEWILSHARVLINGQAIGEIHNGQSNEYLHGGLEFTALAATATLRIESLTAGPKGFLLDSIAVTTGSLPLPPQKAWTSLTAINDSRGGRRLANGGFEDPTSDPDTDPFNSGPAGSPHLSGSSLPGWLVTRENVDIIAYGGANAPEGSKALDTGGHGPGGIAQTITGLQPGAAYTFSFLYARHIYWGEQDMTGEVHANGRRVASLVRNIHQTWDDGYTLKEIPVLASPQGSLTVELRSTTTDQGGNIIYDDVRLRQGGDGYSAWSLHHGLPADREADVDGDGFSSNLEFLFGSDPRVRQTTPLAKIEGGQRLLRVPISGLARSSGYTHLLRCSRDLKTWRNATDAASGMTPISDSSAAGVNGERVFRIGSGEPSLYWTHGFAAP
ncbi:hypothetical protein [Luteolibacter sp. Populi]|uniref:hypothetical protein n=1 Tax=Luteolibacter sp. Populi TaxID=3230487 RepID=UPI003465BAAE